ncbi:MAG: hypothetical protein ACXVFQ_23040 [Solirubrobacteraceae bacterium]
MTIKLHRCPVMFANTASHPCRNVQKALDDAGIAYEVVKHPIHTSKRTEIVQRSGQRLLPVPGPNRNVPVVIKVNVKVA